MLTCAMVVALLWARLFPDLPSGQWLHGMLVEEPLRLASKLTFRDIVLCVILVVAFQAFAMTATIDLALIAAVDTTAYVEVAAAVWSAAAVAKARVLRATLQGNLIKVRDRFSSVVRAGVKRCRRTRRHLAATFRKRAPADKDEDQRSGFEIAYA